MIGLEADELQEFLNASPRVLTLREAVNAQRFGDDVADGHARIERCIRILEDDLHLFAQFADFFAAEFSDVATFEEHFAFGRLEQPQHDATRGRLARTRFADEAERLAASDREIDPVYGLDVADVSRKHARADRKIFEEVADLDEIGARLLHHATTGAAASAEPGTCGADATGSVRSFSVRSSYRKHRATWPPPKS